MQHKKHKIWKAPGTYQEILPRNSTQILKGVASQISWKDMLVNFNILIEIIMSVWNKNRLLCHSRISREMTLTFDKNRRSIGRVNLQLILQRSSRVYGWRKLSLIILHSYFPPCFLGTHCSLQILFCCLQIFLSYSCQLSRLIKTSWYWPK